MTYLPLTLLASSIMLITACGGSNNTGKPNNPDDNQPKKPLAKSALQKAGSDKNFAEYYQLGINNLTAYKLTITNTTGNGNLAEAPTTNKPTTKADSHSGTGFGISDTNLIEKGVDEADFVKQNKSHIFTVSAQNADTTLNVFKKPSTTAVGKLTLTKKYNTTGVFLANDKLLTLANTDMPMWIAKNVAASRNGSITLDAISIANPAKPYVAKSYSWEGSHKTSRRIGDYVYVISSSSINNPYECVYTANGAATETAKAQARIAPYPSCDKPKKLTPAEIAARMPVAINGNKVKPSECLIPAYYKDIATEDNAFNTNITLITKIDITEKTQPTTTCVAASAEHVYMSPKSLYLAGTDYANQSSNTIINKFDIKNNTISYAASGKVKGHINWTAPSFSMNEHKGVLRIVTTELNRNGEPKNMLHTLQPSTSKSGALDILATLPNASNPKIIGKPGERVQGVRFLGDEGYVVTFKNTDPLYKIDLKNANNPKVMGELEMPGYSAYLHRINDKYLLGVGYSAEEKNGRAQLTGIQTTVFDTSNNNPVIVSQNTLARPNDKSHYRLPLANDSRAITTLSNGKKTRIALPYHFYSYFQDNFTRESALEYEIDMTTGKLLTLQERDFQQGNKYSNFSDRRRALMDNNDIYYNFENGSVSKHTWGQK